jgi:hypothetical protein
MSSISQIYIPGVGYVEQALRNLSHQVETSVNALETYYTDINRGRLELDISSAYTLAQVQIPAPPEGHQVMVQGLANISWASGSALHASLRLEAGTSVIATALCFVDSSAGSQCARLAGESEIRAGHAVRMVIEREGSRSTVSVDNHGLWAWHYKEG